MKLPRSILLVIKPLAVAITIAVICRALVETYTVPSRSMEPTLAVGDHFLATPYPAKARPRRGEVVVFTIPAEQQMFVKRVIAEPGDLIEIRDGVVRVNGYAAAEPYVLRQHASGERPAEIVAPEHYFVLGDNREDSLDSRSWGAIPREQIHARARLVFWSTGSGASAHEASATTALAPPARDKSIHWSRCFTVIR